MSYTYDWGFFIHCFILFNFCLCFYEITSLYVVLAVWNFTLYSGLISDSQRSASRVQGITTWLPHLDILFFKYSVLNINKECDTIVRSKWVGEWTFLPRPRLATNISHAFSMYYATYYTSCCIISSNFHDNQTKLVLVFPFSKLQGLAYLLKTKGQVRLSSSPLQCPCSVDWCRGMTTPNTAVN